MKGVHARATKISLGVMLSVYFTITQRLNLIGKTQWAYIRRLCELGITFEHNQMGNERDI